MRRLAMVLTALVALALVAPTADAAKKKHKVTVDATVLAAAVAPSGASATVYAGTITDPVLGSGAAFYVVSGTTTQHLTFQAFTALGSVKGTGTDTLTTTGALTLTGTLKVTSGTGKYKGAKGTLSLAGTIDSHNVIHATVKGSYTYTG